MEARVSYLKTVSKLQSAQYQHARKRVREFASIVFAERKNNRPEGDEDNFLDNLADDSEQEPDFLNHDEALFLTLAGYFAGLDAVANVSAFMLYELLMHHDILAAARAEADRAGCGHPAALH